MWRRLNHLLTNTWALQGILLLALLARIGETALFGEPTLLLGILFYVPLLILKSIRRVRQFKAPTTKVMGGFLIITALMLGVHALLGLSGHPLLPVHPFHILLGFTLLVDISEYTFLRFYLHMHPALAFVSTFLGIILVGTVLLMLPIATVKGISLVDALFTSTSAVCVTGLSTMDTAADFTPIGRGIILILIQIGGLGILTFTNLFGILFRGEKSFRDLIFLTDLVSTDNLRHTFRNLARIIIFVFSVEAAGMLVIYYTYPEGGWFFALFHAISAFCNAGFSTFSSSLYDSAVRFNYPLHLTIGLLIIIGGIGYNVFFNVFSVVKFRLHKSLGYFFPILGKPHKVLVKWDLNTTLVMRTTLILLAVGWVAYFALEYHHSLSEHSLGGKIAESFFGAITPRTAGFNTVDLSTLQIPTIMIYLLLMWIGASPGSTGGGIKTTAFAIATLNLVNQIRGRERLVFKWQAVGHNVIARVTTIISLSLIAIGAATTLILTLQPELPVIKVAFECFSAYSTVGLSLSLTPSLNTLNKLVIVALMFLGRVSFLTFLIAIASVFIKQGKTSHMDFPERNIFVN